MPATTSFSSCCNSIRDFIRQSAAEETRGDGREPVFNELALEVFRLQLESVPVYRRFCELRQIVPGRVTNWDQIPALPVTAFKEFDVTSLPISERSRAFHSSGTSGQAVSRHFHDAESLALYEESVKGFFRQHLLPPEVHATNDSASPASRPLRIVALTPPPESVPHSSLVHMFEVIRREIGAAGSLFTGKADPASGWDLDMPVTLRALEESVSAGVPVALLGTAFSFVHLLDHCAHANLRFELPTGSRVLETGGYKGRSRSIPKAELHDFIHARLGVPRSHILCEYGMSELSSQAYDGPIGVQRQGMRKPSNDPARTFHFPDWTRVRVISPEIGCEVADGETGLVRIVDLANVRSVLALQTEDLGKRRGNGFELIGRASLAEPRGCSLMAL